MFVFKVTGMDVYLHTKSDEFAEQIFNDDLSKPVLCNVQFVMNWWMTCCELRAIKFLQKYVIRFLFPTGKNDDPYTVAFKKIRVYNGSINANKEQLQAVTNILNSTSG